MAQRLLFHPGPNRTYIPAKFDAIPRRLQRLEHKAQIIRLTGFLDKIPLQKKLAALKQIYYQKEGQYSVHELCGTLYMARGTFYNHIFIPKNSHCSCTEWNPGQ